MNATAVQTPPASPSPTAEPTLSPEPTPTPSELAPTPTPTPSELAPTPTPAAEPAELVVMLADAQWNVVVLFFALALLALGFLVFRRA